MLEVQHTDCYNPATEERLGQSRIDLPEFVENAIHKARSAQPEWAAWPVKARRRAILKVRDYLVTHAEALATTISRDNGKTRTDALLTEVVASAMATTYYAKNARRFLKDRHLLPGNLMTANKISKIVRVPFGVVGIISPWNYPFAIPFSEVVMALLAGNAVVLKAASETQMVARAIERCFKAADLPKGLFTCVNIPGRTAGELFLSAGVNKLFFTGSVAVGKRLMAMAAESLTPVSLELGGNDAMLVCADADLERAAGGAVWAGMQNAGQSCGGVERIYVERTVYAPFLDRLTKRVKRLRVGFDADFDVDIGAMTTVRQLQSVQAHIEDAVAKGAEIHCRAQAPRTRRGAFMPPTVLTKVDHSMCVMREETFGPLIAVMPVDGMAEAIRLTNDSDLGLTGSVWSKDRRAAETWARQIKAGVVTINDHLISHGLPETPWGGFNNSGIGRTHGELGFAEMTDPQCIVHDYLPGVKKNMWWYPHGAAVFRGMRGLLVLLYGKKMRERLRGGAQMGSLFMRTFKR